MSNDPMDIMRFRSGGWLHFIGCGGAGTQPLMKIFHEMGFRTSGSDLAESPATEALRSLGLQVGIGHRIENLPPAGTKDVIVVHSSAAGPGNPEIDEAMRSEERRVGKECRYWWAAYA